ncbi:hypothetical protein CkaCkLH20_00331 [Colletotrichum karsti]|uniref:Uncharacterized protein n=1 Tax=Colletotrichum karsti TaxID=1095194 RepID=A0A9P6IK70_9PEZI|nr:uncharacterized protein CkaCkLH20_00331 [Colletotrichum karsti]KAF9882295.1 hypothetical protein CkaCkLH20_00331 [Colletotrichum karsti]
MEGRINAVEAIIQEIRTRKATNPKDKSYGVHAILQTLGLSLTAPDYSRDLGEIHKELFLKLLSWTKSLNLLLCANGPREDGQPSWVPDWRLDSDKMWLKPSQLFGRARNNATPDSDPWWSNRDENKLVVRGRKINHVDWCGRPFQPVSETYDENERAAHIHNITLTRDQYRAHLVRTNPGATFGDTCLRRSHYLDTKDDPSHVFLAEEHLWWTWDRIIQRVDTMTPSDVVERMLSIPRLMEFHASLCNGLANKSRTVFVTAPHPLAVGNCPVGTQVGDVIALVSGVPMPLVLREVAESGDYQLIGFAVVEAMTRGLAWKDAHEDDLEEILLC